jgi:hypothetical protein
MGSLGTSFSVEERGDEPPAAHILKAGPPSADTGLGASVTQHTFNRVKIHYVRD